MDVITPDLHLGLEGWITAELIDARTKKVKKSLKFRNLITNVGLDNLTNSFLFDSGVNYCAVGTGATAPSNADTGLVAEVAGRTNNNSGIATALSYVAGSPDYHKMVVTRLFTETQANGNLTEIGFFSASAGGTMFSRQLFKDGTGTPTTIDKTSNDQLRITYEIRCYPPTADTVTAGAVISGANYDITAREIGVGGSTGNNFFGSSSTSWSPKAFNSTLTSVASASASALPTRTGSKPSATNCDSNAIAAYVNGSFVLDRTTIWNTPTANFTILSIYHNDAHGLGFNPGLPKDNTKKLTLNTRLTWGRYP